MMGKDVFIADIQFRSADATLLLQPSGVDDPLFMENLGDHPAAIVEVFGHH